MLAGAVFFVFLFGPVYWMVVTSLMTESEMLAVPPHLVPHEPTLRNYMTILGLGDPDHLQRAQKPWVRALAAIRSATVRRGESRGTRMPFADSVRRITPVRSRSMS